MNHSNSSTETVTDPVTDPVQPTGIRHQAELRKLPAVDALMHTPTVPLLLAEHGQMRTTAAIRTALNLARQSILAGSAAPVVDRIIHTVTELLDEATTATLCSVINATGVILHTNLGRAPLSSAAIAAIAQVADGYSNLEYDLEAGARGSRHDHARTLLAELTGAEDALVVNNNAAAIYLILTALCQDPQKREVLVSRGQLVEIGGGFRIPDVLRQSGATLVEVGTTNRTHARDFAEPISVATAAMMRIHTSNFKQIGFVTMPTLLEMAAIAHAHGVLLIDDLGSGTLLETTAYGLAPEPTVQQSIAAGADLVTFSGDKLLGGPQAGIVVGRKELIAQLRRHPMARALRVDKLIFAALDATLRSYQRGRATTEIPVWQMISATSDALRARVARWQAVLDKYQRTSRLVDGESAIGGGSLPGETLPTVLLAVDHDQPDAIATQLRQRANQEQRPVVCRIQQGQLLFDPRTVLPTQEPILLQRLAEVLHE